MIRQMAALTTGLALAAQPAAAQDRNCAARDTVVARLGAIYGETRRGLGLVSQGQVMELFASAETGSWTIAVTLPSGITCLIAAGEAFESVAEAPPVGSRG